MEEESLAPSSVIPHPLLSNQLVARTPVDGYLGGPNAKRNGKLARNSAELLRKFLNRKETGAKNSRWHEMITAMYKLAVNNKSPRQVDAFKALAERAYGRPRPSEDELDALAAGGLQIVYLTPPVNVPGKVVGAAPVPDFLPAEFEEEEK